MDAEKQASPARAENSLTLPLSEDTDSVSIAIMDGDSVSTMEVKYESYVDHTEETSEFEYPICVDSDGNYACSACDKKYRSKNHLKRHISIVHLKIKKFPCTICGKRFHSSQPLRIHVRTHTGEKPCLCEECGKSFSDPSALRNHVRMHNRQLGVMCDLCGRYMATESSLRNHMRRHVERGHDKSMFQFHCPECSLNFVSKADLECHFAEHEGVKLYACRQCPKTYKNFQSYQYHRRTHTGEKPYQCKECGNYFRSWNCLKLHSVVHKSMDDRPKFRCDRCGKDYLLIKTLNFHRCEGSYPCWVCKTMFSSVRELEEHKRTHSLEELKRYLCNVCGRRFSKSFVLKKHRCRILVVIDYEGDDERDSALETENEPRQLQFKSEDVDSDVERQEFHIDLCQFVCSGDAFDDAESFSDEQVASTDGSNAFDIYEQSMGDYNYEELEEKSINGDVSYNDDNVENTHIKSEFDVSDELNPLEIADDESAVDLLTMNPTCMLDKSCQKCGGNIDKDILLESSANGAYQASHVCTPKAKRSSFKKFPPLSKALALKPSGTVKKTSRRGNKKLKAYDAN